MASSIRFDTHIESSKRQATRFTLDTKTPNLQWVYEPWSSSHETRHPGEHLTPSEGIDSESTDSDVDESFDKFLPSNEADDILITEVMQTLDDAEEDINEDTSTLVYERDDLLLIWELLVSKATSTDGFILTKSQGMHEDLRLLKDLNSLVFVPFTGPQYAKRNYGLDWFAEPDLKRFESPTALLNDTGINGGAAVIQQLFSGDPVYRHSFK